MVFQVIFDIIIMDYVQSKAYYIPFSYTRDDNIKVVLFYGDNMLISGDSTTDITVLKKLLSQTFT